MVNVKGYEIRIVPVRNSHLRRAIQYKNNIFNLFKRIGLNEDYVELDVETAAMRKIPAKVSWYLDGHHLYYSYKSANNYAENLYVVFKVLEAEINSVINSEKTVEDFIFDFNEEENVEDLRLNARKVLGLNENEMDLGVINKAYKKLAKDLHPDMDSGDIDKFKEINTAHKMLKKELM